MATEGAPIIPKVRPVGMSRREKHRELCTGEVTCGEKRGRRDGEGADGQIKIASDRRVKR